MKLIAPKIAAAWLGISGRRLREPEIDEQLRPLEVEGGARVYLADVVEAYAAERDKKKARTDEKRARKAKR